MVMMASRIAVVSCALVAGLASAGRARADEAKPAPAAAASVAPAAVPESSAPAKPKDKGEKTIGARVAETRELKWGIYPGIYRSYDREDSGFELSVLYRGLGGDVGVEHGHFQYAEVELGFWLVSLGAGVRRAEEGHGTDFQATWAFPVLPVFPYGRWIATDGRHKDEYGFMVKVPIVF